MFVPISILPVRRQIYLFLFFALWSVSLQAQQEAIPFRYFSLKDGLADLTVSALQKDPSGLLWIGTIHGLQRFDGYKFLNFTTNPQNPLSISDHYVFNLALVQDSLLLVFYLRNNELIDLVNYRSFQRTTLRLKERGVPASEQVRNITVNEDGHVVVFTHQKIETGHTIQVYELNDRNWRFERIGQFTSTYQGELQDQLFNAQRITPDQWLIANNKDKQLFLLHRNGQHHPFTAQDFVGTSLPPEAFENRLSILKRDRHGKIWLAFAKVNHLFQYNAKTQQFQAIKGLPSDGEFSLWWQDQKGNVLVSKTDGNLRFPISKELYCIRSDGKIHDFSRFTAVSPHIIDVSSDDFFHTIIFGVDTGLKIVKNNEVSVKRFLQRKISEDQFGRILRGMASDQKGNIYFANENTYWYRLNKRRYPHRIDTIKIIEEKTDTVLRFNCCFDLRFVAPHYLWGIACQGRDKGLLIRYNLQTQRAQIYRYPARFRAFTRDAQGQFWLLTEYPNDNYKLLIFNEKNAEFRVFSTKESSSPFANFFPYFIASSQQHVYWVTTNKGLYKIYGSKDLKQTDIESFLDVKALTSQLIYCVYEDQDNILWLGSSQGLIRFDPVSKKIKFYTEKEGLASNSVSGILEDHLGNLWISTNNGISCFQRNKNRFINFFELDGFTNNAFTRFSFFRDEENYLYFGTINGVNMFRPEYLLKQDIVPNVVLTRYSKYDWLKDSTIEQSNNLQRLEKIVLRAAEQNLELEFTLPVFWNPEQTKYRYKLLGFNPNWIDLGGSNQVKFNQLKAGRYTLLIQGADPRGNWSQSLSIPIQVYTYIYNYLWFWLLLGAGITFISAYALRARLLQKLKLEQLRTKLSTDIHDEVSGLLAGIAMQADVLQQLNQHNKDNNRLEKIGETARKAMSRLRDVIWSIDARKDRLEDLVIRMHEHAKDILHPIGVEYQILVQNLEPHTRIPLQIRQDLFYIYKEAINNVAKHAQANEVKIHLRHRQRFFELEINDNGRQAFHPQAASGNGLQNMKMRAKRIDADLKFIPDNGLSVLLRRRRL